MKKGNISKQQKSQWVMIVGYALTVLALILFSLCCQAQSTNPATKQVLNNNPVFIENKGQFADSDGKVLTDVKFQLQLPGMQVYFRNNGVSFLLLEEVKTEKPSIHAVMGLPDLENLPTLRAFRMDMEWQNSLPNPTIQSENPTSEYFNYYYGHCPDGITGVLGYEKLTYQNIYEGIDLVFYTKNIGGTIHLEYDMVVHPGANPNQIKLKYDTDGLALTSKLNTLAWQTPLGLFSETMGAVYQPDENEKIAADYILENGIISFDVTNYDPTKDLIIDPFFTYYGTTNNEYGKEIVADGNNNVIVFGGSYATGLPVSGVGYTQNYSGGAMDFFVVKLDPFGNRLWSTYYGGSGNEFPGGIDVDDLDNIFIGGNTFSGNFPVDPPGVLQGPTDAVLVSFDENGVRRWAAYFGGNNNDVIFDLVVDNNNAIVACGKSASINLPIAGCLPSSYQGGNSYNGDGFIARFNSVNSTLQWGTYVGGTNDDMCLGVAVDNNNNVIVTGTTSSSNFVPALTGVNNAKWDVFLLKYDANCLFDWGLIFGGSSFSNVESGNAVVIDINTNDIVVTGETPANNFPVLAGDNFISGILSTFLTKFDENGNMQWSTYYPGESGHDVKLDGAGTIWLTGNITSPNLSTNASSFQQNFGGGTDAFVANITSDGTTTLCATYYGGSADEEANGIALDNLGNVLITGETRSADLPGVDASSLQANNAGNSDAFIASICSNCGMPQDSAYIADVDTIPYANDTLFICKGDTVHLMNLFDFSSTSGDSLVNYQNISTYSWFNVTGGVVADLTDPTVKVVAADNSWIKVSPLVTTKYQLTSNAFGCREDVSSITIKHVDMPTALFTYPNDTLLMCGGDTAELEIALTGLGSWNLGVKHVNSVIGTSYKNYDNIAGSPTNVVLAKDTGWYYIDFIQDFNCDTLGKDSIYVKWHTMPTATFNSPPNDTITICDGDTTDLNIDLTGSLPWDIEITGAESASISNINVPAIIHRASHKGWYYISYIEDQLCDTLDQDSVYVDFFPFPTASISSDTTEICPGETVNLKVAFSGGTPANYGFRYTGPGGKTVLLQSDNPYTIPNVGAGTYEVDSVFDAFCGQNLSNVEVTITEHPRPTLEITNAEHSNPDNTIWICEGSQDTIALTFTGSPNFTIDYALNTIPQPSITAVGANNYNLVVSAAGTYTFTNIKDQFCDDVINESIIVAYYEKPTLTFSANPNPVCKGQSTDLTFTMTGDGPFDVNFTDNTLDFDDKNTGHIVTVSPTINTDYETTSITDVHGCEVIINEIEQVIVHDTLKLESVTEMCNGTNDKYTVTITLSGGTLPYSFTDNSVPLSANPTMTAGGVFTAEFNSGDAYDLSFFDDNNCNTIVVTGQKDCDCTTDAGAIALNDITLCEDGQTIMIVTDPGNSDANDVFEFVLHGTTPFNNNTSIILDRNALGTFNMNTLTCGVAYYITRIAGNDAGSGQVDINDGCFDQSGDAKVIWRCNPDANFEDTDFSICDGSNISTNVLLTGSETYYNYLLNAINSNNVTNPNNHSFVLDGDTTLTITNVEYDDAPACAQAINKTLTITALPHISLVSVTEACNPTNDKYTVTVTLSGGTSPYSFTDNSLPLGASPTMTAGGVFTAEFNSGDTYDLSFFDDNNCNTIQVTDQKTCNCNTDAGAIATNGINLCEDGQTSIIVTNPWTSDANDVFEFVLHSVSPFNKNTTIILDRNAFGNFNLNALTCGATYYITGIAGNDNGSGQVDFNDACFDQTGDAKVVWRCNPDANFEDTDFSICDGANISTNVLLTGSVTDFNYVLNATNYDNVTNPNNHSFVLDGDTTLTITQVEYADAPACAQTINKTLTITALPHISLVSVTEMCNGTNDKYTVTVTLSGGTSPYSFTDNSVPLGASPTMTAGGVFTAEFNSGDSYSFTFFDVNNCNTLVVTGQKTCACGTSAGDIFPSPNMLCEDDKSAIVVTTPWSGDANDVFEFVLHDGDGINLGDTKKRNNIGEFYKDSLACGVTYFITGIAGNDDGTGHVDVNDPCLSKTAGVEVFWRCNTEVSISALPNDSICLGDNIELQFNFTNGAALYDVDAGIDGIFDSLNSGDMVVINPTQTKTYTFTSVTDKYCTNTISENVTIVLPEPFVVTPSQTEVTCHDDSDGAMAVLVSGGFAPYTYQWFDGNNDPIAGETNSNINDRGPGLYKVEITDVLGCITSEVFTLTAPPLFNINLVDILKQKCFQDSAGALRVEALGGEFYAIDNPLNLPLQVDSIFLFMNFLPNSNLYLIRAIDNKGCVADTAIDITGLTPIAWLNTPQDRSLCPNTTTVLEGTVTGGNGGYTYYWGEDSIPGGNQFTVNPTETTEYCVFAKDQKGCPSTKICTQVTLPESMNLVTNIPPSLCPNMDGVLSAAVSGGALPYTYNWENITNPANYGGANWDIMIDTTSRFEITITDDCGTSVSSIETVFVPEPLPVTFDLEEDTGCAPFNTRLTNTTIGNYKTLSWDFGDDTKNVPFSSTTHDWHTPDAYTVTLTLTDSYGCKHITTKNITVYPNVVADFSFNPSVLDALLPETQLVNYSVNADEYLWTVDSLGTYTDVEPLLQFPEFSEGKYTVCLKVENQWCEDSLCKNLIIRDENYVFVPNFFTPNADNINDMFHPVLSSSDVSFYEFHIFDRWGELIFSSTQQEQGWNGTYKNKPVKPDTYTWKLRVRFGDEAKIRKHMGVVTIGN